MNEWENEPNELDFEHAGLACKLRRNRSLAWSGYVGVVQTHPLHGLEYGDKSSAVAGLYAARMERPLDVATAGMGTLLAIMCGKADQTVDMAIEVHGGLTYSAKGWPGDDGLWYFGFDCSHSGDLNPKYAEDPFFARESVYRNMAYAKAQTEHLAEQLATVKS